MKIQSALLLILSICISCAVGPTPETTGFDYPQAGIKFRPRRHVTSDTVRGNVATVENPPYTVVFPLTKSDIENPNVRLLTTCIAGDYENKDRPLFDEVSELVYGIEIQYDFELIEEKPIELPWPGLEPPTGTLRIHKMTPKDGSSGIRYAWSVLVKHYGNTYEFSWRDVSENPPAADMEETFFHWTHGLSFYEPEVGE
ncbi:MAG: hypothetical protein NTY09_10390 [bacterium]|nr:hypothetical protein [bacterium]